MICAREGRGMFGAMGGLRRKLSVLPGRCAQGRGAGTTVSRCGCSRCAAGSGSCYTAKPALDAGGSGRPVALRRLTHDGFGQQMLSRSLRSAPVACESSADPETLDGSECRPRRTSIAG